MFFQSTAWRNHILEQLTACSLISQWFLSGASYLPRGWCGLVGKAYILESKLSLDFHMLLDHTFWDLLSSSVKWSLQDCYEEWHHVGILAVCFAGLLLSTSIIILLIHHILCNYIYLYMFIYAFVYVKSSTVHFHSAFKGFKGKTDRECEFLLYSAVL